MLRVGDQAPEFQLEDMLGTQQSLKDLTATKPVLLAFFKISCPVCQFTLPFLERLSKSDNVEFIAISQDDPAATEEFRKAFGVTFTTLLDPKKRGYPASNGFEISHVPSLFLVAPGGQIEMAVEGFSRHDLESLGNLAGLEPFRPDEKVPEWKSG